MTMWKKSLGWSAVLAAALASVSVVAAAGCSSSSQGPAFAEGNWAPWTDYCTLYQIRLTSYTGECPLWQQNDSHKPDTTYLELNIGDMGGPSIVAAGTYMLGQNAFAASLHTRDGTCNLKQNDAVGGSVTLTEDLGKPGATIGGSYELQLADGTKISGTFSAASCDPSHPTGPQACIP